MNDGISMCAEHPADPGEAPRVPDRQERTRVIVGKLLQVAHSIRCGEGGKRDSHVRPGRAQLLALRHIAGHAGTSVSELARALGASLSNASNLADKLEAKGWAQRRRAAVDQRSVLLYPTRAGTRVLRSVVEPAPSRIESALHRLSQAQLAALEESLDALLHHPPAAPEA